MLSGKKGALNGLRKRIREIFRETRVVCAKCIVIWLGLCLKNISGGFQNITPLVHISCRATCKRLAHVK